MGVLACVPHLTTRTRSADGLRSTAPAGGRTPCPHQSLFRHADPPDAGDAPGNAARRGRGRAAGTDPTVTALCERMAALLGKQAADVPAVRHHVQRRRHPHALPIRRGGDRAPDRPHPHQRGRRSCRIQRGADPTPAWSTRHVHCRAGARRYPAAHALCSAATTARSRADRQHRRRHHLASRATQRGRGRRARRRAGPPTWTARGS